MQNACNPQLSLFKFSRARDEESAGGIEMHALLIQKSLYDVKTTTHWSMLAQSDCVLCALFQRSLFFSSQIKVLRRPLRTSYQFKVRDLCRARSQISRS